MIKFLELFIVDMPELSFLFANLLATSLTANLVFVIMILFSTVTFSFIVQPLSYIFIFLFSGVLVCNKVSYYNGLYLLPYLILPFVFNVFLKYKKGGIIFNIIYTLRYNKLSRLCVIPMALIEWFFIDKYFYINNINYFLITSLTTSYLVLFLIWFIQDCYNQNNCCIKRYFFILKEKFVEKCLIFRKFVLAFIRKKPKLTFVSLNLLCNGCIYIILLVIGCFPFYDYSNTSTILGNIIIIITLLIAFLLFMLRYTLIINVYDFYLKEKIPCVSDFILKIKNNVKAKIMLFVVIILLDFICYLIFKNRLEDINLYQIFLFVLFYGLSVPYLLLYYYWHLENKHKDVLAEVEVKKDTGVV